MSGKRLASLWALLVLAFALVVVPVSYAAQTNHGWARLANYVFNSPAIDMQVDGIATASGVAPSEVTGYFELASRSHQITVMATGQASDATVSASMALNVEADEQYALVLVGQIADKSVHLLMIDETAAVKGLDTANQGAAILVHNLKGVPSVDLSFDDASMIKNLAYGEYAVGTIKAGNFNQVIITPSNDPKISLLPMFPPGYAFQPPGDIGLDGLMGSYPGDFGSSYLVANQDGTQLTASQFLAGFSGRGIGFRPELASYVPFKPQTFSFDTLLAALDKTGLKDTLDAGPYILLAPTDTAFAALPAGTLDKWMADPQALGKVLRYHIAQGMLSATDLMQGKDLKTLDGNATVHIGGIGDNLAEEAFGVNGGVAGCGCNFWTKNNNRVFVIDTVLTPPSS